MIKIEKVSEQNWNDLVTLFSASPECRECWCMNHRSEPSSCPTGDNAKVALKEEITAGRAYGLLAKVEGIPAGWCAVDPVATQVGHDFCIEGKVKSDEARWMIHCLYVDEKFRGKGVSKSLISAANDLARANGATEMLAFPIPEDSAGKFPKDLAEFSGRLSTYYKHGFVSQERLNDFYQVVTKSL